MSQENSFVSYTAETAPAASRAVLAHAEKAFGYIPGPLAKLAESPAVLEAFGQLTAVFDRSSFSRLEREVLTMTVAWENECDYCVAFHTRLLHMAKADDALVGALRDGAPLADAKLETLRSFTRAVMAARGKVDSEALATFFAAGFTKQQALDVVLGVATYTLSTYANRLTSAP